MESIGGNLDIRVERLISIKELSKLQSIGGSFRVYDGSFTSFEGMEKLTNIKGDFEINGELYYLESFKGLSGLQSIGGSFKIITTNGLNSLVSFEGLENLTNIGGNFDISGLRALASFKGLENLISIGGNFDINRIPHSFKGLGNLASIGGNFEINGTTDSFEGLENLASIGGNFKINNATDSFEGLENLTNIGGNFEVRGNRLTSFKGLDKLKQIDGDFNIDYMNSSSSFEGLSSLESIGGDFIATPYNTTTIYIKVENHLSHLTTVGGNMEIWINTYNDSSKEIFNVNFSSLESVGGSLSLSGGYSSYGTLSLPLLQATGGECSFNRFDLIDLPNLESINGALEISYVNSIGTLDKLKSVGDITISYCRYLYDFCNWVPVLTDYNGMFSVSNCGYNPTKYQILNGECSQTPENSWIILHLLSVPPPGGRYFLPFPHNCPH